MKPVWTVPREWVEAFVAGMIPGCERGFGPCQTLAIIHNAQMVAGVVFHNWQPECGVIEISGASTDKRWLTRPVLRAIFGYPFDDIGCQAVVTRVDPENKPLRRMWKAIGGTEYLIPRLRGRDKAEVVITLTEENWRRGRIHAESTAEPAGAGGDDAAGSDPAGGAAADAAVRGADADAAGGAVPGNAAAG